MIDSKLTRTTSLCTINAIDLDVAGSHPHTNGKSGLFKTIASVLMLLVVMAFSIGPCLAEQSGWSPGLSEDLGIEQSNIYDSLYDSEPAPVNGQNMTGFEVQTNNNQVSGLSILDNSFDQQSEYRDTGDKDKPFISEQWYIDLSGGRINGIEEAHQDEIPQNDPGAAATILPTVGYQNKFFSAEFSEQGFAAAMITAEFTF